MLVVTAKIPEPAILVHRVDDRVLLIQQGLVVDEEGGEGIGDALRDV